MRCEVIDVAELDLARKERWSALRLAGSGLDSPFFCWRFVEHVQCARGGVKVAVLYDHDGEIAGFLPFERKGSRARPVAASVSEIHGLIGRDDLNWQPEQMLAQMGVKNYRFLCLPTAQQGLVPFHAERFGMARIDLTGGYEAYVRGRKRVRSSTWTQAVRKERKLQRDFGPIEFQWHVRDDATLTKLSEWKRRQYQRTGVGDPLKCDWVLRLLRALRDEQEPNFGGVLSTLSVRGEVVATNFGLRDGPVMNCWFAAYDPRFANYSPGLITFAKSLEAAPQFGVTRCDLGRGDERYKMSLSNASLEAAEGTAGRRPWDLSWHRWWLRARRWGETTRPGRTPLRWFRRFRDYWQC